MSIKLLKKRKKTIGNFIIKKTQDNNDPPNNMNLDINEFLFANSEKKITLIGLENKVALHMMIYYKPIISRMS